MEGQSFSHYNVLERLGGGGMGAVYRALDTKLNRHVALKFLPHELTRDDEARHRFVQEAQAASALDHPNICTIHEIDSTPEGQMFITMAFYDGATLKKRIAQGPLPVEEALDIAIQVAQGLVKAHEEGIVHRDIKPANVMLTKDGFVKIVDFGIAKLLGVIGPTQVGSTLGTVSYMSPEQVAGEDADPRSDVWALGVVLYEMLTGQLPFRGESHWVVMSAIADRELEPLCSLRAEVTADIESVVMGALEKTRESRTRSAEELCRTLKECRARLSTGASARAPTEGAWLDLPEAGGRGARRGSHAGARLVDRTLCRPGGRLDVGPRRGDSRAAGADRAGRLCGRVRPRAADRGPDPERSGPGRRLDGDVGDGCDRHGACRGRRVREAVRRPRRRMAPARSVPDRVGEGPAVQRPPAEGRKGWIPATSARFGRSGLLLRAYSRRSDRAWGGRVRSTGNGPRPGR